MATGSTRYDTDRFTAYVNAYTQQDSRTATGDLNLSAGQRQQLSLAGDLSGGIPILSIDSLDTRAEVRATYERVDTSFLCGGVRAGYLLPARGHRRGFRGHLYRPRLQWRRIRARPRPPRQRTGVPLRR